MEGKKILGDDVKKMSEDQEIILKENMWYNKLMEMTPFSYERTTDKIKNRYLFQGSVPIDEIRNSPPE